MDLYILLLCMWQSRVEIDCYSVVYFDCITALENLRHQIDMWQSRVEIQHYSVAYFNRITTFETLVAQYFH